MRRVILNLPALLVVLAATPLAAQPDETGEVTTTITFFKMFFMTKDLIGQILIAVLVISSALTLGYVLKLANAYRRSSLLPQDLYDKLGRHLSDKKFPDALKEASDNSTYLGKLVSGAMREAPSGYGAMERALEEVSDAETSVMLRPIEYLNVVGNIAPMVGLPGTVYGMIVAFQTLVSQGRPEPAELAAGTSTALVPTLWGLVVAIPALAGYALIRNKVDALSAEGLVMAEQLLRPFKPRGRNKAGDDA